MSAIALDPLIAEAKRRARRRHLLLLAIGVVTVAAVATYATDRGSPSSAATPRVSIPAGATGVGCGVRGVGARILSPNGATLYREPARPMTRFPEIQCSGQTIWAVWMNGVATSHEAYLGVRSLDGGRTWRPDFAGQFFGTKAPHALDAYLGVWTLRGAHTAYFVGACPACADAAGRGTNALYVTTDGGGTFRTVALPTLDGYTVTRIAVHGAKVTLWAKREIRGIGPAHKTATVPAR